MYEVLKHTHSGLRWVVLALLVTAIFRAIAGKKSGRYEKSDKMINLFAMISLHLQVTLGIILAFVTEKQFYTQGWMKSSVNRFYGMEHILMMVLAAVIITIGRKKAEKKEDLSKRHATILVWFTITLIIIFAGIPWPFRNLGGAWF